MKNDIFILDFKRTYIQILLNFLLMIGFSSCGMYSFTGASIHPEAKTISIETFPNLASMVNPTLSQEFTDALQDKFQSQTSLTVVTSSGDYEIEGEIVGYSTSPMAIQGNETAALNRLTIAVNVRFTNKFSDKDNFEQRFSRYVDYDSSRNLSEVEQELVKQINEVLVEDIFNKAVVNW
ncbi:MAG: LptE family protein [Bacteroidales bacterium]|nr:LptE family protein [Bacteroidales bacterium]MDD4575426.1 LptE family protein [Bacteroidales bacterium]